MFKKEKYFNTLKMIFAFLPSLLTILGIYLLMTSPYLEQKITLIIIGIIVLLSIICIVGTILLKNHKKFSIVMLVINLLISTAIGYCDYLYYSLDHSIGKITNTTEYVHTYIYTLKDSSISNLTELKSKTLGLQNESSATCYQTVINGLNQQGISTSSYTLETFSNFVLAAEALLNKKVDAIAVDEQGLSMISEVYQEFQSLTHQIGSFKELVSHESTAQQVDTAKEPFVMLINGVDSRTGDLSQGSNSDVIMLAAFNPQTMKLSLISIPRDTYVPVTCEKNKYDKITHSGSGGINCTVNTLEKAFDININYYVKANFRAVVDIIDAIGGIDVNVPLSFCEQNSKDEMNTICLEEGMQHLDGEQALALSRHRKTLPNGDIGRGLNQQIVIEGMIDKLASGKIITSVDKLLNVLGSNVQTNMDKKDMYGLFSLLTSLGSKSLFSNTSALQITSSTIGGVDRYIYTDWAKAELYYYIPYVESMEAVKTEINRILGDEEYPLPDASFNFNPNEISTTNTSKINTGKTPSVLK